MNNILTDFVSTEPESKSGIYIFVSEQGQTLYVGQSLNIKKRCQHHNVRKFLQLEKVSYKLLWCPLEPALLDVEEIRFIKSLAPLLNTTYNSMPDNGLRQRYRAYNTRLFVEACAPRFVQLPETPSVARQLDSLLPNKRIGDNLIAVRDLLKDATLTNPVDTDFGSFSSFSNYLAEGPVSYKRTYVYQAIKLAENWGLVLRLASHPELEDKTLSKSMRVSRTIKIIDWYLQALQDGRQEEDLTLDLYWEENEPSPQAGPTKKQLQQQNEELQAQVLALLEENARLRAQLKPMPAALLVR